MSDPVSATITVPEFELFRVEDRDGWQKVDGEMVFDNPHIQIEKAHYLTPHRQTTPVPWMVAHRKSAVAIAPVLEDGRFVLISQERLPGVSRRADRRAQRAREPGDHRPHRPQRAPRGMRLRLG